MLFDFSVVHKVKGNQYETVNSITVIVDYVTDCKNTLCKLLPRTISLCLLILFWLEQQTDASEACH